MPSHTVLMGDDFLSEFAKRLEPKDVQHLEKLKATSIFQNARKPDYVTMFRELENYEIMSSWAAHTKELGILLKTDVLLRAGEKRYFYLRESFREARRSTLRPDVLLALKVLIKSDLLPFLANPRFRAYLEPLIKNRHLDKLFLIAGDYSFFRNNAQIWSELSRALSPDDAKLKQGVNFVTILMGLVQDLPEEVRSKARRIRDSGYFQAETFELWKDNLYQIFLELVIRPSIAESIQLVSEAGLLIPAIKRAQIDWEANLIRTIQAMPEYKDVELSSFLVSLGFKVFANSKFTPSLLNALRMDLLTDLPAAVGDWAALLEPRLKADHDMVLSYMEAIERERRKEKKRVEENQAKATICDQNLRLLNGKKIGRAHV